MRRAVKGSLALAMLISPGWHAMLAAQEPSAQSTEQQSASSSSRVTVHGIVRNQATGEPLARALVQVEGDADTGALTDNEGRFEIADLPVGPQIFRVVKPGYRDRPYANEEPGLQAEGPARSVLVAAQMPELEFALDPNGAIHGHIELSTGDPAEGFNVELLKQVIQFGRASWAPVTSTRTNGEGSFRMGGLPDGLYVVMTQPSLESEPAATVVATGSAASVSRSGYPGVYYPDAHDMAGASRIRVSGGSQAEANFSLRLEPFYPVMAVATMPGDSSGSEKVAQMATTAIVMDSTGHPLPYSAQFDLVSHNLQTNLPDGTYILVVRSFPEVRLISGSTREFNGVEIGGRGRSSAMLGSASFTVAGRAITGLRVPLGPQQAALVHIRLKHNPDSPATSSEGGSTGDLANLTFDAADTSGVNSNEGVWSMDKGPDTITFTAQPGSYWLNVYPGRKGLCVDSFNAGSINLAREPLAMSLTAVPPPMELTLRDDCGTLALTLPPSLATFMPGEEPFYTVYVVPETDTVQQIPPMTMHPSSGATLSVDSLTPGGYQVYFFDSAVHLEYRNAAALGALSGPGQHVTVAAGVTTSLVLEGPQH